MTPPPPGPTELIPQTFHALILADLGLPDGTPATGEESGDAPAGDAPPEARGGPGSTPMAVDRDDLEEVMATLSPRIRLTPGPDLPVVEIQLRSMDDLHPDALLTRLPLFAALEQLAEGRGRETGGGGGPVGSGGRSGTGSGGADDRSGPGSPGGPGSGGSAADPGGGAGNGLLDQVLAQTPGPEAPRAGPTPGSGAGGSRATGGAGRNGQVDGTPGDMAEFLRRITLPHTVPEPGREEEAKREVLHRMRVDHLRAILHHARFQQVESVWRGLEFLVRRLDTGPDLKVWVLHLPGPQAVELAGTGELGPLLERARRAAGLDSPWSAVLFHHAFGARAGDLEALAGLARIGEERQTAFLAEVTPDLLSVAEDPELATRWEAVRRHGGAGRLGLLLPRFLLRAPYGAEESPCERLDFEELQPGEGPDPGMLLWGHPGFAALLLLGRTFRARHGEGPRPIPTGVDGLSPILHQGAGGAALVPPAELMLGGVEVQQLAEVGLIPLVARAGDPTLRFPVVPSVAATGERLQVRGL